MGRHRLSDQPGDLDSGFRLDQRSLRLEEDLRVRVVLFPAGSALCGFAWSAGSLIVFRMIQGVGGGMMTPVGTAMLFRAFPAAERARASAIVTVPTAIAPALGPVLGGWLVDNASWRWIFYVNVPVGLATLVFALLMSN